MDMLWPHWLRPYWLFLLPLFGWLLWQLWHRQRRSGRWQALLPVAFHQALLSGGRQRRRRLPWVALGLAWLLCVLALLGPSWQRVEQPTQKRADPLVVMLQLTPDMLAGDAQPNRLEQAKRKLLDLLRARRDAQTAIVVYAGSAHTLVPLSDDLGTARNLLEALKPSIMPEPGQRADLAVTRALDLLRQGTQGRGHLLLIGSALSAEEQLGVRDALDDRRERLAILGIGSPEGAPMLGDDGGFLKDASGAIRIARLDETSLRGLTDSIGGEYQRARPDDQDLRALDLLDAPDSLRQDGETKQLASWADQGHWLLLPLLLLAACAGRRGWLFCLPLLCLALPQPSYAFGWDDLWLRPDQQGQRLLQVEQPAEAARHFEHPQWQGEALYRAGDYAAAAERFAQEDNAVAHYNRGNALAKSGELEAALDAYEQALERQPELAQARDNKALVEALLRQQQEQQQQPQESQSSAEQSEPQTEPSATSSSGEQTEQQASPQDASPADQPPAQQSQASEPSTQPQPGTSPGEAQPQQAQNDATQAAAGEALDGEQRDSLEQWLRQIPDDPGELLRRKFLYEQQQNQEQSR